MSSFPNHMLSIDDWSKDQLAHLFDVAFNLREERRAGIKHQPVLDNQTLALFFEKPSLRTRVSFEVACTELGGKAMMLDNNGVGLGQRESVEDVTRVLSRMVHGIAARVFAHDSLVKMANQSDKPVINMLSDDSHPCQGLADAMTLMDEFCSPGAQGRERNLTGRTVVFVGDGNNVARTLFRLAPKLDYRFILSSPEGFKLQDEGVEWIEDPALAVAQADCIYCDTFVSMGEESEKDAKLNAFAKYKVDEALLAKAPEQCVVLHCLPAYRGIEITDAALDGPQSRAFPQAENRLHAQKGLLAVLMGGM